MKHRSRATLAVHVTLSPPASERVIHITAGDVVDLDEIVRPARPGITPVTLRDAIGDYVQYFDAVTIPISDTQAAAAPPRAVRAED